MQVTELKNENLIFQVKIVIPSSKIADEVQKELDNLSKKVKLDGFRAGKVPYSLINKKYRSSVRLDVVEKEINHAIKHVIEDHRLKILSDPKLEDLRNEENEQLEFTLTFELLPDIELPNFKDIIINRPKLIITDKEVDEQIKKLASISRNYNQENEGKIEKNQQVTIDAIGYIDDKAFEGGKITDYKLVIGSGDFIDGFEQQLIGAKTGDEVEVNVTFPPNYHVELIAGKLAKFVVQIKSVHIAEEVEINDEFAKKFKCETLEQLRDNISKRIADELSEPIDTVMKVGLFDQLENLLTFEVPRSLIDQEVKNLKSQIEKNDDTDQLFKGKSQEEIDKQSMKLALRRVRIGLMLTEYMKNKGLKIEQNDIKDYIMAQARSFPGQENLIFDFYQKNPQAINNLKSPLLEKKAVQHIFDNEVILQEHNYTREELEKFLKQEEERII